MYETKFIKIYFKDAKQYYGVTAKYKNILMVCLVIESLTVNELAEYNFSGIRRNFVFDHKKVLLSVNALLFPDYILQQSVRNL